MSNLKLQNFLGTHYEIGIQQGNASAEIFKKAIEQVPNLKEIRMTKPIFLPMPLFIYLARRQATKVLEKDILQYYPKQARRMAGMIKGAGIDRSWAFFSQYLELSNTIGPSMFYVPACSSLGFLPKRTSSGEVIVAKNFDYPNSFSAYQSTRYTKPKDGYGTLGCSMAVLPGMLDGMNEHGLTVTYNLAYTIEKPRYFVPLSIVLQEMLETCKSTEEAVNFIANSKRAGSAMLMLADPSGDIRAVEISHNHSATREPEEDQIINTNNYLTQEMRQYEIPHKAVFTGKGLTKGWYGIRVHESSEQRFARAQELLNNKEMVEEKRIISILRDHGRENKPSNLTICQHGDLVSTLRSMIFYPKRKMIKVLYGNTCQNEYTEFSIP